MPRCDDLGWRPFRAARARFMEGGAVADRFSHIAAGQFIASYGRMAGMILRARADLATERGHTNAAATWREIADAADAVQEPATAAQG